MAKDMSELELEISFNTPAFLGNANQEGQWRTPPFKALIRQWWRVVKVSQGVNVDSIRKEENILFGNALEEKNSCQSKIKLKFKHWHTGKSIVIDAGKFKTSSAIMRSDLYLGYGPVGLNSNKPSINPKVDSNTLSILYPSMYDEEIKQTIQLIKWFGTIGSRSRNGWGSVCIDSQKLNNKDFHLENDLNETVLEKYSAEFNTLMKDDWAKGIGFDETGLLVWKTKAKTCYEDVLRDLAQIKYDYRKVCRLKKEELSERHIVALPISQVSVRGIDRNLRNPNQIRFKVEKDSEGSFYGLIFHMPCRISEFSIKEYFKNQSLVRIYRELEQKVWLKIYDSLDKNQLCSRLG